MNSLHEKGYIIDSVYNYINRDEFLSICNEVKSVLVDKVKYLSFRHSSDHPSLPHKIPYTEKEQRLQLAKDLNLQVMQHWSEVTNIDECIAVILTKLKNIVNQLLFKIYPELNASNIVHLDTVTYYENGDYINLHHDGKNVGRLCAVLLYLNSSESYKDGGGKLILNDENRYEEILPIDGNLVILDFKNHNIRHAVEPVKNNFERYCYLSFVYNRNLMK